MEKYILKRHEEFKPFAPFKIQDSIKISFKSISIAFDESVF